MGGSRLRYVLAAIAAGAGLSIVGASGTADALPPGGHPSCGNEPLAHACFKAPHCTADGWVSDPLPAGTKCTLAGGKPGVCSGSGFCVEPPRTGHVKPAYYLVTLLYGPPGNKSKATYGDGSSAGTTTSTSQMFGTGITAGVTGTVIATGTFQTSNQNTQSFQVKKTTTTSLELTSVADPIRHGQDRFYLWMNADLTVTQAGAGPVSITPGTVNGQAMDVVDVTVDELSGAAPLPSWKQQKLAGLGANDFHQILAVDPWASAGTMDPARYVLVDSLQLEGPDNAGDDLPGQELEVSDEQLHTQTATSSSSLKVSIGVSAGFSFFGLGEKAEVIGSATWTNTSSTGTSYGSAQKAKVELNTTTVGFHDVIDVYEDAIYHTFAFVSETQGSGLPASSAAASGTIRNPAGQPLAHQLVTVTFADGRSRRVFTDARGTYRVFRAPAGALKIASGDAVTQATVVPGRPIVQHLTLRSGVSPRAVPAIKR